MKTGFVVIFERDPQFDESNNPKITTPKLPSKLSPKMADMIIKLIIDFPKITKEELAKNLDISIDGIKYHIKTLSKQGLIKWEGSSKNGEWKILKKEEESDL